MTDVIMAWGLLPCGQDVANVAPKTASNRPERADRRTLPMHIDPSKGHPDMDYREHMSTYQGFLRFTQIAIVFLVLLLVAMYVFLVPKA